MRRSAAAVPPNALAMLLTDEGGGDGPPVVFLSDCGAPQRGLPDPSLTAYDHSTRGHVHLAHVVAQLGELDLALDELRVRSDDHARIVLRRDPPLREQPTFVKPDN